MRLVRWIRAVLAPEPEPDPGDWDRNPLAHPDLRRMSPRELADLTFDPARIRPD